MQCSNCQFENIPGSEACGRCGSSLRVGTLVMDVNPPRAPRWRKSVRQNLPTGLKLAKGAKHVAEATGEGAVRVSQQGAALTGRVVSELAEPPTQSLDQLPMHVVLTRALI